MKLFLNIFFLLLISCNGKSQETNVNLSKGNISYQEFDKETGWKRILLIKPNKWGFVNNKNEIMIPFVYDFVNPFKNPIGAFVGILELVSEIAKMVSFSFRLFGNVFAGEVLLTIISFLMPYGAPLPFLMLEIFVGLVQALVFAILTLVFIQIATVDHH
jgi:hypothetical protein